MPKLLTPESVLGQYEQILIYGEPKTGKTFLSLTAPDPIYILCIGRENELKTRYSRQFMARYPDKPLPYFDTVLEEYGPKGDITDNPVGNDRVGDTIDAFFDAVISGEIEKPNTIIVDNLTVLQEYQMNKAIIAGYETASDKSKTALTKLRELGIVKPGDGDWGAAQSIMAKFLNYTTKLQFHIIFVAHEFKEYAQNKSGNTRAEKVLQGIYPLLVGKQRTDLARYFDCVWRTTKMGSGRSEQYFIQTTGDDTVVAGTRVGGILDQVEQNLDLTDTIDKFKEHAKHLNSNEAVRASLRRVKETKIEIENENG